MNLVVTALCPLVMLGLDVEHLSVDHLVLMDACLPLVLLVAGLDGELTRRQR